MLVGQCKSRKFSRARSSYTRIKNVVSAPQLPTAWLKHAASLQSDLDFVSLFDSKSGLINKTAKTFGLVGLPRVDVANTTARLDL